MTEQHGPHCTDPHCTGCTCSEAAKSHELRTGASTAVPAPPDLAAAIRQASASFRAAEEEKRDGRVRDFFSLDTPIRPSTLTLLTANTGVPEAPSLVDAVLRSAAGG